MDGNPGIPVRTPAIQAGIIMAVKGGVPKTVAAGAMGVSKSAFFAWLRDDQDFKDKLDEAHNAWVKQLVDRALEIALASGHKDSAAMTMWLLERRAFNFFSRKERVNLGSTGDPDDIAIEAGTTEGIQATGNEDILALLREAETIASVLREAAGIGGPAAGDAGGAPAEAPEAVRPARTNGKANGVSSPS